MPGYDRISELPESLLTQILSLLPTKDSVKTSVLSTRWKNLWLNVPWLDLNTRDFPFEENHVFINFIDRFLEFNPELSVLKLKVDYSRDEILGIKDRIGTAISRGIQHLELVSNTLYQDADDTLVYPCIEFVPLNLYTSKTLVFLKLSSSGLWDTGSVSMPCLKFMQLVNVRWRGTMNPEKLILGCPVLEELTMSRDIDDELVVTRLRSRSLKKFCVPPEHGFFITSTVVSTLDIDAPGLEYMSLKEDHFDRIVVKNLSSLLVVDLAIRFLVDFGKLSDAEGLSKRNEIRDFLTGISSVRHMIISHETMEALCRYSNVGVIPKFNNLSRVQAMLESHLLDFVPTFLESCPNLKHLSLKFTKTEMVLFALTDVPQCLLSTLECVEIKGIFFWEEEEKELARYFLENAAVLKKLVVSLAINPQRVSESKIYEELNKITKRSQRCGIILDCESC